MNFKTLISMLDSDALDQVENPSDQTDFKRILPFIILHFAALTALLVNFSWACVALLAFSYFIRMFAITAFYHRYFSHKTFKTSRPVQFIFAFLGCASVQRGPLWWASHHRQHHRFSDQEEDAHSPVQRSFWYSHMGWFLTEKHFPTNKKYVRDWMKFKELVFLNRFDWFAPVVYALLMIAFGKLSSMYFPELGLTAGNAFVWGFIISTLILYHGTFTINSLAHKYGSRTYETRDQSRNNFWLALITLGEGWHNNHHHYPNTIRQGFRKRELDVTYYILYMMKCVGLVSDFKALPKDLK